MPTRLDSGFSLFAVSILCAAATAFAQDAAPAAEKSPEELIQQLDSEEYSERQDAGRRLAEMGKRALPALEKGAVHDSREVAQRSLDLLKKLHESSEQDTKSAAAEALQRLAKSDNAPLARRAKEILEPTKPAVDPNVPGIAGRPRPAIAVARRMSIKTVNGVREIESEQGGKKLKIVDDPNNGIQLEITEKVGDKEETKKFDLKNADELKEKHPEAHEIYEKFGKRGDVRIQIGGGIAVPGLPGAPGIPAPPMPLDPAALRKLQAENLERAIQSLDKSIDRLQQQKKQLEEQKAALEAEEAKR